MNETTEDFQKTAPSELPDSLAVRLAARFLGPEWKQRHDLKKRLQRRTVLSDCRLMLRYAFDEGYRISDAVTKDITTIDAALMAADRQPLSELPSDLLQKSLKATALPLPTDAETPAEESLNAVVMRVHNALSDLVAPATAESLRATDPAIVSWGLPWIVKVAMIGALLSIIAFVMAVSMTLSSMRKAIGPAESATPSSSPTIAASPPSKQP